MIDSILRNMGIGDNIHAVSQIPREEDGTLYKVWKVSMGGKDYILKEAKGLEAEIYAAYFSEFTDYAPKCYHSTVYDGKIYKLLEYISGENLMRCSRSRLILALDSLIAMQKAHWNSENSAGFCFEKALSGSKTEGDIFMSLCWKQHMRVFFPNLRLPPGHFATTICCPST